MHGPVQITPDPERLKFCIPKTSSPPLKAAQNSVAFFDSELYRIERAITSREENIAGLRERAAEVTALREEYAELITHLKNQSKKKETL